MRRNRKYIYILASLAIVLGGYYYYLVKDLPSLASVKDYQPNLVTKVYSYDGRLVGEFYIERRVVVPLEKIPKHLTDAFLAAEDSGFYEHEGISYTSILRAFYKNLTVGKMAQGGSTITQQVARSFFLSSEKKLSRKIREVILSYRLEKNLSKNEILKLYLNQIYFGSGAYGVQTASQAYFGKNVENLTLAESALLAGLPKAPSKYSPIVNFKLAKERQGYVLKRMVEEKLITEEAAEKATAAKLVLKPKEPTDNLWIGPYFTEHVRRYVEEKYGDDVLYKGGLSIYTTLDVELQEAANTAIKNGVRAYDKRHGYRGPVARLKTKEDIDAFKAEADKKLLTEPLQEDRVYQGVITAVNVKNKSLNVDIGAKSGVIAWANMEWARIYNPTNDPNAGKAEKIERVFKHGDVVEVTIKNLADGNNSPAPLALSLEQTPQIQAALIAMDPATGHVKAMVGGNDFSKTQFNRAVQAARQPGSSFKPIIYAAAIDKNYTPATVIMDTPLVFGDDPKTAKIAGKNEEDIEAQWRPQNYDEQFNGPTTVREALAKSRNIITIKILKDIGVGHAIDYAKKLGITSPLAHDLSLALGSSAVTLLEMTTAFSTFANQGVKPDALFLLKIIDKDGVVLEDSSVVQSANAPKNALQEVPPVAAPANATAPPAEQTTNNQPPAGTAGTAPGPSTLSGPALSKETAYIITSLLQGVIENGTGARAKALGRPAAGKTGTTNKHNDAWFLGYVPGLTAGAWIGYDEEKELGRGETGAIAALPIWLKFMQDATRGTPVKNFPVPEGIEFARIDPETGLLATRLTANPIFEVFKTGTAPKSGAKSTEGTVQSDFFIMDTGGKTIVKPKQEKEALD
ncbi:PBP1A family penicillin-binding protein [bacterium]|nr:MAG: PBP1A family penicillin-binding protein [bacterium]